MNVSKDSVEAMVRLLKINDTSMSPDELINYIKAKRTDDTLEEESELKVRRYFHYATVGFAENFLNYILKI